jgi:hypothetical protein
VTSAGQRNATLRSGVSCVRGHRLRKWQSSASGLHPKEYRYHPIGDLPAGVVGCSIRLAYQAADVSHPNRAERARHRARKFRQTVHS